MLKSSPKRNAAGSVYKSVNTITFQAMAQGALFGRVTFAMDRGYDDN